MTFNRQNLGRRLIMGGLAAFLLVPLVFTDVFAQRKVTLIYTAFDPGALRRVEPLIAQAFEISHPNIKIKVENLPFRKHFETIEAKLGKASSTPDVYDVDSPLNTSYAVRRFTMPLDEYLAKYSELADLEDYVPSSRETAIYKGKYYSLPRGSSSQFMFYNKDLFSKYGIQPPEPTIEKRWTWEKVVEVAKKLTIDEDGDGNIDIWGFAFDQVDRPYQLLPLPQSLGQPMIGPDQLTATGYVDSPKSIQAGQFYFDLYNTWKIAPKGFTVGQTAELFGAGKLAIFVGGCWNADHYKEYYPNLNWDVAPHPYFEGGKVVTPTGAWNIGVNPNSKHKDEAALFAIYAASRPMAVLRREFIRGLPTRKSVYKLYEPVFTKHPWNIAMYEALNTATPRTLTPGYLEFESILTKAWADMRTGVRPEEALGRAAKEIDRQLKKYAPLVK